MPRKSYIGALENDPPKTYPLVRFLDHAIWPLKTYFKIRREKSYPLWGSISYPSFLQADRITSSVVSKTNTYSTQQPLHYCRGNLGINLSNHFRPGTNRDYPSPETQWSLPIPHRTTSLSQSHYLETLSSPNGTLSLIQAKESARPLSAIHDSQAQASYQGYLRSGFYGPYPQWQTGDGPNWLQSKKVGQTVLSSSALFQWDHQRFLAWRTSLWGYPYRHWSRRTPKGLLCQVIPLGKDRNYSSRQGVLRSRDQSNIWNPREPFLSLLPSLRVQSREESQPCLIKSIPPLWRSRSLCTNP